MKTPVPLTQDIVLIGGGHTHALLLRAWGMEPLPGARLTLINPGPTAPYTGMLPGFVAGHYGRDELEIDLVRLARFAGARLILGAATGIDRAAREITLPGRPPIAYDFASIDIGITSTMPEIPGFTEHGIAAKPLGAFAERWQSHLDGAQGPVAVIGGGIAGVELALAMRHALGSEHAVRVIDRSTALTGVSDRAATDLRQAMQDATVELIEDASVAKVTPETIQLDDGRVLPATLTVGAAGARPYDWLEDTGLDLADGYVAVKADLTTTNDDRIFAVGDCAHLTASPRPKAGVFAVRAAPVLTFNLKAAAAGRRMKPFRPQAHYLKLVSLGGKAALADKWGRSIAGPWVWRWKDKIDRQFMDRLAELPPMSTPLPAFRATGDMTEKPLCGGCGSKVGPDVLTNALATLPTTERADVLTGRGDDAAVLAMGETRQALTTDHLRAFWNDPWVFGRIAAIHAMGDVWAMGATPQAVLAQITLPIMSPALQSRTLAEVLNAANAVFAEDGAEIVGGHSTLGAEMTLGFTVTGLVTDKALTLDGAKPGDALILTRPIGSGTLFAAEMAGQAEGDHIAQALDILTRSQGDAARALAAVAHAMTDVTGFGLAGHARRMAEASGATLTLELSEIPTLPGAKALAAAGMQSTIWPDNRAQYSGPLPDTPVATLLFDPQTAGGFLASVPADKADAVLATLAELGHPAAIIGEVGTPADQPLRIN